ncbi:hypothetical protein ACWGJT_03150 [Streptomyces xantholiticus]
MAEVELELGIRGRPYGSRTASGPSATVPSSAIQADTTITLTGARASS